jgi:hypothetical protein
MAASHFKLVKDLCHNSILKNKFYKGVENDP